MKKHKYLAVIVALLGCASLSWGFASNPVEPGMNTTGHQNSGHEISLKLDSITQVENGPTTIQCSSGGFGCLYNTGTGKLYPGGPPAPEKETSR